MASSPRSAGIRNSLPGIGFILRIEADTFELLNLAPLTEEAARRHAEVAGGAFGLAR